MHYLRQLLIVSLATSPGLAADVTNPAEVTGLRVDKSAGDVVLDWDPVTTDAAGNPGETIAEYNVYRGSTPDFVPDKSGGSNRIGTSMTTSFTDTGALGSGLDDYYLVSAVDSAVNEGVTRPSRVTTPPVLSGFWTATTIELNWTDALPVSEVSSYRVYYGNKSGQYEFVDDVGLTNSHTLAGLALNVNWYIAVTAVDLGGNESGFSNEHVDAVAGTIDFRVHDDVQLCNGCGADTPEEVVRRNGREKSLPVTFPEGDWTNITLTYSMDSKLDCPNECDGSGPCGDPWDRTATVFLVLNDCITTGAACSFNGDNVELLRAITPFGTNPTTGPRVLTFDITPLAPLLTGDRHVGSNISTFVSTGWWVNVDFHFSEDPAEASPKPPADGVVPLIYHDGGQPPTASVSIPATATSVKTRLFTTGHGGADRCDGGTNDGAVCTNDGVGEEIDCPSSPQSDPCRPCDEFCHRVNEIRVDGSVVWSHVPWVSCAVPPFGLGCLVDFGGWNACGTCFSDRAGWCPGNVACHQDAPCDQDLDATSWFPPGGTYDVDYTFPVRNGSWSKSLLLFWYE